MLQRFLFLPFTPVKLSNVVSATAIILCFLAINLYLCYRITLPFSHPPSHQNPRSAPPAHHDRKASIHQCDRSFWRNNMCESICVAFRSLSSFFCVSINDSFFVLMFDSDESTERINKSENNKSISGSNVSFEWQQRTKKLFVSVDFQFIDFLSRTHVIDMQSTIHHSAERGKKSYKIEIFSANIWNWSICASNEIYICLARLSRGMNKTCKREKHERKFEAKKWWFFSLYPLSTEFLCKAYIVEWENRVKNSGWICRG